MYYAVRGILNRDRATVPVSDKTGEWIEKVASEDTQETDGRVLRIERSEIKTPVEKIY